MSDDFFSAILKGQRADIAVKSAHAEIKGVLDALRVEIHDGTGGKLRVECGDGAVMASLNIPAKSRRHTLCFVKTAPEGYPVSITTTGMIDRRAMDRADLVRWLQEALATPANGRFFNEVLGEPPA